MNSQIWWFTARAGGIVGWAILAASTIWGLALSAKATRRVGPRPAWLLDLHRYLGGLGVIFTAVHVAAIVADSYVHIGLVNLLVPFTGDWHPIAVGWGVIAAYLLVAVEATSLARKHLPKRLWRLTHFAAFPLFGLATVHGLTAGTDATSPALRIAMAASVLVVLGLTSLRIRQALHPVKPRQTAPANAHPTTMGAGAVRPEARGRAALRPIAYAPPRSFFVPAPQEPPRSHNRSTASIPDTPFDWAAEHRPATQDRTPEKAGAR
ncbi:MAG: ferric reductase-like transmembrane domain-containing protein [Microthrixaceae bacterium]